MPDNKTAAAPSAAGRKNPAPRRAGPGGAPQIYEGDCREVLKTLPGAGVHLVLTDPPYFLDRLDGGWSRDKIEKSRGNAGVIGGLPVGMKFDPAQGRNLQNFIGPVAQELLRVLKPGGFLLMFAAPRLVHRAAVAVEDAGFEIRDQYAWRFTRKAQYKAFTVGHFIRKRGGMNDLEKARAVKRIGGRRTPQLRPQFESVICAQKPREGTFVDNWLAHETGLIDSAGGLTGGAPETVMTFEKQPRDPHNGHLTPKPVALLEHLIRLFSAPGQTVLDPFMGSGSTCVAARAAGRRSIGVEIEKAYVKTARSRLECGDARPPRKAAGISGI